MEKEYINGKMVILQYQNMMEIIVQVKNKDMANFNFNQEIYMKATFVMGREMDLGIYVIKMVI